MQKFRYVGAARTPKTVETEKIATLYRYGRARITIDTPALAGAAIGTNSNDPMFWLTGFLNRGVARVTATQVVGRSILTN